MRRLRSLARARGFTLLELIIALSLSTFVMIGIITVATSMVKYQLQMGLRGSAGGGTLLALGTMQKQLENTSYLDTPPYGDTTGGAVIKGCTNWSQQGGATHTQGGIDTSTAGPWPCTNAGALTAFAYCVNASNELWMHYTCVSPQNAGSPPTFNANTCATNLPAVTAANCGTAVGTAQVKIVGAKPGVYKYGTYPFFYRTADNTGLDMHFIVGVATPTANNPTPAYYQVDTRVFMEKSYATSMSGSNRD